MYGDLKGTATADWPQGRIELREFAETKGLDLEKYQPIGLEIDLVESQPGELHEGVVFVLATRKSVVGDTYEEVARYYASHDETLPISRFQVEATLLDLLRLWKRFALSVYSGYKDIDTYDVVQEFDLRKG